jgi:hypothetical protein
MAVSFSLLLGERSTARTTAFVTSSASPSSAGGNMVLAAVLSRNFSVSDLPSPSIDGWGLTWSQIQTVEIQQGGNAARRLSLFKSSGTAVPGTKSTIHFSGTTAPQGVIWCYLNLSGVDTASPIVQSTYNASTVAQSNWGVNLSGVSTNNAVFGTFGSVATTVITTGVGLQVVYANSTFFITSTSFPLNFFNEFAGSAVNSVGTVQPSNAMNQAIAVEIAAHLQPNPVGNIQAKASVVATIQPNDDLKSNIQAQASVQATLTRSSLDALQASLNAAASVVATLTRGQVTKALSASLQAAATLVGTISGPGPQPLGRGATKKQYVLQASLRLQTDGFPPMSRSRSLSSTVSPRVKQTLAVSAVPQPVDLTSVSNARFLLVVPDATFTDPVYLGYSAGDSVGIALTAASLFSVGAPTTGFNLFTSANSCNVRVGVF